MELPQPVNIGRLARFILIVRITRADRLDVHGQGGSLPIEAEFAAVGDDGAFTERL